MPATLATPSLQPCQTVAWDRLKVSQRIFVRSLALSHAVEEHTADKIATYKCLQVSNTVNFVFPHLIAPANLTR